MEFPKIDYKFWLSYWNKSIGKAGVYTNKNIEKYIQFDKDINHCTSEIIELTNIPPVVILGTKLEVD